MRRIVYLLQLPWAFMVLYLDVLSVAALFRRRMLPAVSFRARFALLVPAHNEEVLLPRLLGSLREMHYPADLYDVHVVADNCSDRTAAVSTAAGAVTHERHDTQLLGKGYALAWLLDRLRQSESRYDAYVVLDADSLVSPNFLEIVNRHLASGSQVIQGYYGVLNADESWLSALRSLAFTLFNDLRPRGRDALGLSAGLRGNGMCFSADVIERFGWDSFTLAEDVELHLKLVAAGIRVAYAPTARVLAEMPASLRQAKSQNVRWERGRLQMVRILGPGVLRQAVRRRSFVPLDAVAEQAVPPFSVLSGATMAMLVVATVLRLPGPRRVAVATIAGELAYVATGLRLGNAGPATYCALAKAPLYIIWKLWIYAIAAFRVNDTRWIRTPRSTESQEHAVNASV